jgi:hypothetical protein
VAFQGQQPKEGIVESTEFVANLGYSEQGGDVIDEAEGRKVFAHKMPVKPLYRRLKLSLQGLYRPGSDQPFVLLGDGVRIWLKDEP